MSQEKIPSPEKKRPSQFGDGEPQAGQQQGETPQEKKPEYEIHRDHAKDIPDPFGLPSIPTRKRKDL